MMTLFIVILGTAWRFTLLLGMSICNHVSISNPVRHQSSSVSSYLANRATQIIMNVNPKKHTIPSCLMAWLALLSKVRSCTDIPWLHVDVEKDVDGFGLLQEFSDSKNIIYLKNLL